MLASRPTGLLHASSISPATVSVRRAAVGVGRSVIEVMNSMSPVDKFKVNALIPSTKKLNSRCVDHDYFMVNGLKLLML